MTKQSTEIPLKRIHIADVKIKDHTERLSWIRTSGRSVNILISERIVGTKLASPRLIGRFTVDEGEQEIKDTCRDYVRRQNHPNLDPIPTPLVAPEDRRPDPEIEFDRDLEAATLFGAPV